MALCTPSPCVHRATSHPVPGLYLGPQPLKTRWQGSPWLLAVSLDYLQLPFPCLGKRVGWEKGLILGKGMSVGSFKAASGRAAFT